MEGVVLFTALLTELDRSELACYKVDMEGQEGGNDECEDGGEDVGCHHKVGNFIVKGIGVAECARNHRIACRHDHPAGEGAVEEHVHEEFVVVEADAVSDPWAVMVHL